MKNCTVLLPVTVATMTWASISLPRVYHDARTGLVIHFPEGWHIDRISPAFTILSFPPQRRPPQILVPMNEAELTVIAAPSGIISVDEWLKLERIRRDRGYTVSRGNVSTANFGHLEATVIRWHDDVIPDGRTLDYMFELQHRLYKVGVLYRGASKAKYFEDVLLAVIEDLDVERRE